MADRKHLQKRGNQWHIRVPRPPRLWGMRGELVCSLKTPDLTDHALCAHLHAQRQLLTRRFHPNLDKKAAKPRF